MIAMYPHTATLSWFSAGTYNTVGVWTPGTTNTLTITCDIQPASDRYAIGEGGAVLNYNWKVYAPLFTGSDSIPKDAKLSFFEAWHIIVQLFNHQKHVEIKCQD